MVACSDVTKSVISKKNRRIWKKITDDVGIGNSCMRRSAKIHVDTAARF